MGRKCMLALGTMYNNEYVVNGVIRMIINKSVILN